MITKNEQADLADPYICIDERLGKLVYDYFNEALCAEKARSFEEEHLMLCFRCQEIIFTLDFIFDALRDNLKQWPEPQERSKKKNVTKA